MEMRKMLFAAAVCLTPLLLTCPAGASTIDQSANAVQDTWGWTVVAQTFTSPGGELDNYSFWLGSTVPDITFEIIEGDAASSSTVLFSEDLSSVGPGEVTVDNIDVDTTGGDLYSAVADLNDYSGYSLLWNSSSYAGGSGEWGYATNSLTAEPGLDTGFIANFGNVAATPEPDSLFLVLSGALGALSLRRRLRA